MSELFAAECCCDPQPPIPCFAHAYPCECEPNQSAPTLSLTCAKIAELWPGGQFGEQVFRLNDICYVVDSQVTFETTKFPVVEPTELYNSCAECCGPKQYKQAHQCECGTAPNAPMLCVPYSAIPPTGFIFFKHNGICYRTSMSFPDCLLGTGEIVTPVDTYATCEDCCDSIPPDAECPTDCTACPQFFTVSWPAFNAGDDPDCYFEIHAGSVLTEKLPGAVCNWCGLEFGLPATLHCGGDHEPTTVEIRAGICCVMVNGEPKWTAGISNTDINPCGPGFPGGCGTHAHGSTPTANSCPPTGTYTIVAPFPNLPPTLNVS